jgi:hypothetical protein
MVEFSLIMHNFDHPESLKKTLRSPKNLGALFSNKTLKKQTFFEYMTYPNEYLEGFNKF